MKNLIKELYAEVISEKDNFLDNHILFFFFIGMLSLVITGISHWFLYPTVAFFIICGCACAVDLSIKLIRELEKGVEL